MYSAIKRGREAGRHEPSSFSMQLFYAADTPEFTKIKGEYKAKLVSVGILSFVNDYYAHHLMRPGHWEAEAFSPFEEDKGWGYNLFTVEKDGDSGIVRTIVT